MIVDVCSARLLFNLDTEITVVHCIKIGKKNRKDKVIWRIISVKLQSPETIFRWREPI